MVRRNCHKFPEKLHKSSVYRSKFQNFVQNKFSHENPNFLHSGFHCWVLDKINGKNIGEIFPNKFSVPILPGKAALKLMPKQNMIKAENCILQVLYGLKVQLLKNIWSRSWNLGKIQRYN